jgi:hypothetical protein
MLSDVLFNVDFNIVTNAEKIIHVIILEEHGKNVYIATNALVGYVEGTLLYFCTDEIS